MTTSSHLDCFLPQLLFIWCLHLLHQADMKIWACLQAKVVCNLGPQLLPSEQVSIVDVVRLVLTLLVGGDVDCRIAQHLHIRDIIDGIPCKVTAWKPASHSIHFMSTQLTPSCYCSIASHTACGYK